jgi:hypothetical protein
MVGSVGPGFVAVANNSNRAVYSTDGISWTESTMPLGNWRSLAYGDGKFVTVPYGTNQAAYSTDGVNWTYSNNMGSSHNWNTIAYGDGKFVALTYGTNQGAYSTDGINWDSISPLPSASVWFSITYGNGKFVALSNGPEGSAYSTDGISWTAGAIPSGREWVSVIYGDGKFVALAYNSNEAAYSTDGINWTISTLPLFGYWTSITHGDGKFVALLQDTNQVAYSTDGINWTASTLPSSNNWTSINHGDGKFVVVAYGSNETAYSTDGITWTASTLPFSNQWYAVASGQISTLIEVQVSIGNQGEEGAEILAPVDVYTVPEGLTTNIDKVTVKNTSVNTITYDLGVLNAGVSLTDQNALINDQAIFSGGTATVTNISNPLTAGQRLVVLPSAVDVVEVKVFGTENAISNTFEFNLSSPLAKVRNDPGGRVYIRIYGPLLEQLLAQTPSPVTGNRWLDKNITFSNLTTNQSGTDISSLNNANFIIYYSGYNDHFGEGQEFAITLTSFAVIDPQFEITGGTFVVDL